MKKVTLKGQFCIDSKYGGVKAGKFGDIEMLYDGKNFHIPSLLDTSLPYNFIKELDEQYGSSDWKTWEVIAKESDNGEWHYVDDYGRSDAIIQYNRDEW